MNIVLRTVLLIVMWFGTTLAVAEGASIDSNDIFVPPEVERALLAEDWNQVFSLLKEVTPATPSPVLRLIKGHADLALNRNNESYCLFFNATSKTDINKWLEWATGFENKHENVAISHYLKGDALARLGNWSNAIDEFNKALSLNPLHTLSLNARGVVYAQQNNVLSASKDFSKATSVAQSPLADAHANIGSLWIQRKDGKKGALDSFTRAVNLSPEFALALHGKACIELVKKQFAEAETHLKSADKFGACFGSSLFENEARYAAVATGMNAEVLLADIENPGMSLQTKVEKEQLFSDTAGKFEAASKIREMTWLPFNQRIAQFLFENPAVRGLEKIHEHGDLKEFGSQHPNLINHEVNSLKTVNEWDSNYGGAKAFNESLKAVGSLATGRALATGNVPVVVGGLAATGTALKLDADRNYHNEKIPGIISTLQTVQTEHSASKMRIDPHTTTLPAGVSSSMDVQENCPFKPLYGLGYAIVPNSDNPSQ